MKKVLITGGAGYVGRHVVDALVSANFDVYVADPQYVSQNEKVHLVKENIFSGKKDVFKRLGSPDVLIHLAWQDGFKHYEDSHIKNLPNHYQFVRDMIAGGLKHFVGMGSMHEVGYKEGIIDETTPTNPLSPYGIAKNALRQLVEFTVHDTNTVYQWIRAFYITGDDSRSQSVFRKILDAEERGDKTFPFTSGKNKYDFIDVKELGRQIAAVAGQDQVTGIINCCSGIPISLGERVEQFIKDNKLKIQLQYGAYADRAYDSPAVWGDATKIHLILKNKKDS